MARKKKKKSVLEEFGSDILKKTFSTNGTDELHKLININKYGQSITRVLSAAAFFGGTYVFFKGNMAAGIPLVFSGGLVWGLSVVMEGDIKYKRVAKAVEIVVKMSLIPARLAAKVITADSTKKFIKKADEMGVEGGALEAQKAVEKFKKGRLEMEIKRIPQNNERRREIKKLKLENIKLKEEILNLKY